MNGLEEIQENLKRIKDIKKQEQQKIIQIEKERNILAQKRNKIKAKNIDSAEINVLGNEISKLGKQSQEMQNELDSNCRKIKNQVYLLIDNLVTEGIRKVRKIDDEIQELKDKVEKQNEKNTRYKLQKQEFYTRFGRMPELSENAVKSFKCQEEDKIKNLRKINQLNQDINSIKEEISEFAKIKQEIKHGNLNYILQDEVEQINEEEIIIEEIQIEDIQIEELKVAEFKEETNTENIEIEVDNVQEIASIEENIKLPDDEIEKLARKIVEEIALEQSAPIDISLEKEVSAQPEDIITFEAEEGKKEKNKEKVIIPLFGQKVTISNIIVKFEDGELVYKAQMSDEEEIKIYPAKISEESVILRDKQNRTECEQILVNYVAAEDKVLDRKVLDSIDPLICELLIECAEQYDYNAQELIYNYAMSFSNKYEIDKEKVPDIIYNISYIQQANLNKKEQAIVNRICKKAKKNMNIEVISAFGGFAKFKYILKRIFAVNNIKVLPDVKY